MAPPKHSRLLIRRVLAGMKAHNTPVAAGGVAFFSLLAIVPTLIAAVSIYGLVSDPDDVAKQIESLSDQLPESSAVFIGDQLDAITTSSNLSTGLILGLLAALWSSSGAVKHLISTINHIYDAHDERSFFKVRGLAVLFLIVGIVFFGLVTFMIGVLPWLLTKAGFGTVATMIIRIGTWPILAIGMVLGVNQLYQLAPAERPTHGKWWTMGGAVAAAIFVGGAVALQIYTQSSLAEKLGATWGTFLGIILLMFFLLIAANAVLIGAEVNAAREPKRRNRPTDLVVEAEDRTIQAPYEETFA